MSSLDVVDKYVISLDPGINATGISVADVETGFAVVETVLVKNNRAFTPDEKVLERKHGSRAVKLLAITKALSALIDKYKVTKIVLEAPFYNPRRPQAYGCLLEVIFGIKYTVLIPRGLEHELIEPRTVKKYFTDNGAAAKELMKQFLETRTASGHITLAETVIKDQLSEHEIDAIAIGFVHQLSKLQAKE